MGREKKAIKTVGLSILANLALALLKGVAGLLGHSHALIADAIESTTDVFASILVLLGLRYAQRPADKNHPYGHGKIEPLITFVVVVFLIVSATIIAYNSILNLQKPQLMPKSWTLCVLGAIILWKEASFHYVLRKAKQTESSALKAEAWHHRSDAITSLAAFTGISIALVMGKGYEEADDWAALFAAGFILYNCYKIIRPALGEVMDEQIHQELQKDIEKISLSVEGILGTEKCYIRKAGMQYHVDLHALVNSNISVKEGHHLAHTLKDTLMKEIPCIANVLIHVEPS